MQFSSTLNNGLVQTLDRLCSSTVNTYSFKDKATDLNDALDWYCELAFMADGQWSFDDINQTSPPIDTQSIVSGTNRYKFGSFTEKIINLIRLEALDGSGNPLFLIPETFDTIGSPTIGAQSGRISGINGGTFQEWYLNAPSGTPTHYIKFGDFVYLRPKPDYNYAPGLKAYFNRQALKFNFVSVTVDATSNLFTASSHGLVAGDTVIFETDGTIPTGLTEDQQYYVISSGLTTNDFKVSTTLGGSAVDITDAQTSSNHSFLKTSTSPGINPMHHLMLVRKAALTYLTYTSSPKLGILPQQVLRDEMTIKTFFGRRTKDMPKRMTPMYQDNR